MTFLLPPISYHKMERPTYPSETRIFNDPRSGVEVTQLTNYRGHSHHLYFTNPGWYDGGRKLVFGSDRANASNLYDVDLESGEIRQLTFFDPAPMGEEVNFLAACLNPTRDELYFFHAGEVRALDLESLEQRTLYSVPPGFVKSMLNCTADGNWVCMGLFEDLSDRFRVDLDRGYVGFRQIHQARPKSQIVAIPTAGGSADVVWEEKYWIGHVNTSPRLAQLLTFCHEGPWGAVDHRIWGFDLKTREAWKIRPRQGRESFGHEYWHSDGEHLGYHGQWPDGKKFFGQIRFDNTAHQEVAFPHETGHIHSQDFALVVGDAGKVVRLWKWDDDDHEFHGPHILCEHNSSMHIQRLHVHPRFDPTGQHVLFTSDMNGYGNLYLARVPPFEEIEDLPFEFGF